MPFERIELGPVPFERIELGPVPFERIELGTGPFRKDQLAGVCGGTMEIIHRANGPARGIVGPMLLPNGGNDRLDAFHVPFDPSTEPVLDVVVNAVSVIHNVEPDALEPLESAVDPDALEGLVGPPSTRYPSDREVTFVYEGLEITVNSDGHVWLEWLEEES